MELFKPKGVLMVLVGPSGSGKGTVLKEVLKNDENTFLSISATTRNPRPGEENGKNYYFMSKDEFKNLRDNNGFLEWAEYCDNFYGTPKKAVLDSLEAGKNIVLEIEMQGAKQIKKMYKDAVLTFITPPSIDILRKRLIGRQTEDAETVDKRLKTAEVELEFMKECDYVVINDKLEDAVDDVCAILRSESIKIK